MEMISLVKYRNMANQVMEGSGLNTGLDVVLREEARIAVEVALAPAIVMATYQVDDVALGERQVVMFGGLVTVQRLHFLQVYWGGVCVIVHWWREGRHEVIKTTLMVQ